MFSGELARLWNVGNNYYKLQPYNGLGLSRDEVNGYLQGNVLVLKEKSISTDPTIKNIFHAVDGERILFLGAFTGEVTEENGLYKRTFVKLRKQINL
jgi:lysozyme family protein